MFVSIHSRLSQRLVGVLSACTLLLTAPALSGCAVDADNKPPGQGDDDDDGADDDDGEGEGCVGVDPNARGTSADIGGPAPQWSLEDVQPRSCGYGETYGLEAFRGYVTLVALLASW